MSSITELWNQILLFFSMLLSIFKTKKNEFFCFRHKKDNYVQYCLDCNKNLCYFCIKEHKNHHRREFHEDEDLHLFDNNQMKEKVDQVQMVKNKMLTIIEKKFNQFYEDIKIKAKSYHSEYKRNYETIRNANYVMKFNITEKMISILRDLNLLLENNEEIRIPKNNNIEKNNNLNNIGNQNIVENFNDNIIAKKNNINNNCFNNLIKHNVDNFNISNLSDNSILNNQNNNDDNIEENEELNTSRNNRDNSNEFLNNNQNMNNSNLSHSDENEVTEVFRESNSNNNNNQEENNQQFMNEDNSIDYNGFRPENLGNNMIDNMFSNKRSNQYEHDNHLNESEIISSYREDENNNTILKINEVIQGEHQDKNYLLNNKQEINIINQNKINHINNNMKQIENNNIMINENNHINDIHVINENDNNQGENENILRNSISSLKNYNNHYNNNNNSNINN